MNYFLVVAKDLGGFIQIQKAETYSQALKKFKKFNPNYKFIDVFILKTVDYYESTPKQNQLVLQDETDFS